MNIFLEKDEVVTELSELTISGPLLFSRYFSKAKI